MRISPAPRFAAVAMVALSSLLAFAPATSAAAAPPTATVAWTTSTVSAEYGTMWTLDLVVDGIISIAERGVISVTGPGVNSETTIPIYFERSDLATPRWTATVGAPFDQPALPPGQYQVNIQVAGLEWDAGNVTPSTQTPAALTIAPAALGTQVTVTKDPSSQSNAVVAVAFTGGYLSWISLSETAPQLLPAGTWNVTAVDGSGESVWEQSLVRSAGIDPSATAYWNTLSPETDYTVTAAFTPDGTTDGLFTFAPGEGSYRSPVDLAPLPQPTPTPQPNPDDSVSDPFSVPLWLLLELATVALGAIAAIIVLVVRWRRRRARLGPVGESADDVSDDVQPSDRAKESDRVETP